MGWKKRRLGRKGYDRILIQKTSAEREKREAAARHTHGCLDNHWQLLQLPTNNARQSNLKIPTHLKIGSVSLNLSIMNSIDFVSIFKNAHFVCFTWFNRILIFLLQLPRRKSGNGKFIYRYLVCLLLGCIGNVPRYVLRPLRHCSWKERKKEDSRCLQFA